MLLITKRISSRLSHFHHRRHRFSMSPPRRRSSSLSQFRELLDKSRYIVALTGAGISAESGVPTFRGAGGLWRQYKSQELANPEAFKRDPSLVWQFYEYRRQLVSTKEPNPAHKVSRIRHSHLLTVFGRHWQLSRIGFNRKALAEFCRLSLRMWTSCTAKRAQPK